jgi:hypothetical protein
MGATSSVAYTLQAPAPILILFYNKQEENIPMNSIPISDIFLIIFVLVDDWYQTYAKDFRKGKPGQKPEFSDSEVMTMLLAMDYIPFPSETQFVAFVRANYSDLFPKLLDQSQFNRRARDLCQLVEQLRRYWVAELDVALWNQCLLDTKPVPVVGYRRNKKWSDFLGSAEYGYCASKKMYYFGYKLVTVTTLEGLPLLYDLVPANTDERLAAESIIDQIAGLDPPVRLTRGWAAFLRQPSFFANSWRFTPFDIATPSSRINSLASSADQSLALSSQPAGAQSTTRQ